MNPVLVKVLLAVCALLYYLCFAFSLKRVAAVGKEKTALAGRILYILALVLNASLILINYIDNIAVRGVSFIPFVSVYQVLVFLGFCFFLVRLFIEKVCKCTGYSSYFLLASAVVMTGPCFMSGTAANYPPALQSVFFIPHIFFYMLSYSLAAVAFLAALAALIKNEDHDGFLLCCARVLFPFMTAGLFCGAVWADQVWGEFWAWDVKECWSLVTWLNYMICLHLFKRAPMKKYARILMITGFVFVVVTFFFSNILKVNSLHSY